MISRFFSAVFLLCAAPAAFAQVTLTAANFNPVAGDAFITKNCDTTGVTPGPSGPSQVWNFSSLSDVSTDTGVVTPCTYMFPSCTWAIGSTIGISSLSTVFAVRNYIYEDATKLSQYGVYIATNENTVFSDPMDQLHYPFTYNSTFNDNFAGIATFQPTGFSSPITAHQTGSETVTCDAYGMLILPHGLTDTNTIRVHTTQGYKDNADLFSTLSDSFVFDTYTWYKPDFHTALLTIQIGHDVSLGNNYKLVSYTLTPLVTTPPANNGVAAIHDIDASLQVFPNPTTGDLNINYRVASSEQVRITLSDVLGRVAAVVADGTVSGAQKIRYNTASLPKGLYLLRLQSGAENITRKIEIQ